MDSGDPSVTTAASSPSTVRRIWDRITFSSPPSPTVQALSSPSIQSTVNRAQSGGLLLSHSSGPTTATASTIEAHGIAYRDADEDDNNGDAHSSPTWTRLRSLPRWSEPQVSRNDVLKDDDDGYFPGRPLDGEEGVVIDDEACFVDDLNGKIDFLRSLPFEISLFILLQLDFRSLLTASSVSRQWRSLAMDNLVWRDLFLQQKTWKVREDARPFEVRDDIWGLVTTDPDPPASKKPYQLPSKRNQTSPTSNAEMDATASRITRRLTDIVADLSGFSLASRTREPDPDDQSLGNATAPRRRQASSPILQSRSPRMHSPFAPPGLEFSRSTNGYHPHVFHRTDSTLATPRHNNPSTPAPSMSLALDWPRLYKDRQLLDESWSRAKPHVEFCRGHTDSVYCVQFDKRKVVSGSRDRTIAIWDIKTTKCLKTLHGHEGSILCLQFDERILVSGSSDCRVLIWDLIGSPVTGEGKWEIMKTLVGHTGGVLDVCFDEKWIISGSKDTKIIVWERETGKLHRMLEGHSGPVNAVQLHTDRVVSASGDGLLKMWDAVSGELMRVFTGHSRGLACVYFGSSGKLLATGSNDKTVKIWEVDTGVCVLTLEGHTDLVRSLAFDDVRKRLVSASYDRTLRLWDVSGGGTLIAKYKAHTSLIFDVQMDVSKIVSCSHDQRIAVLDFGYGLDVAKFL